MITINKGDVIQFTYTNWKGETGTRKVFVYEFKWGSNEWHKEEQWLLHGLDEDKGVSRLFAMKDMKDVTHIKEVIK